MPTIELTPEEDRARQVLVATMRYRGVSGAALGRAVGTTRATINDKINGRSRLGLDDLVRFGAALGVEPAVFFLEPDDAVRWAMDHAPAFASERGFAELPFLVTVLGSVAAAWVGVKAPELAMWFAENQRGDESYDKYHSSQSQNRCFGPQKVTNLTCSAINVHRQRTYCRPQPDHIMHKRGAPDATQCLVER